MADPLLRYARKDQENLEPALKLFAALQKAAKTGKGFVYDPVRHRVQVAAKDLGLRRGPLTERLYFEFSEEQGTHYNPIHQRIHFSVIALSNDEELNLRIIRQMIDRYKLTIVHELVHHVDYHRMGRGWGKAQDSYYSDKDENPKGYYNDPTEMNAYYQMAAAPIVEEYAGILKDLDPNPGPDNEGSPEHQNAVWSLSDMAATTWQGFYKDWKRGHKDDGRFWEHLTPENQRRMQKRVYDLYSKTVLDAKQRLRDLKRKGDPMAELV